MTLPVSLELRRRGYGVTNPREDRLLSARRSKRRAARALARRRPVRSRTLTGMTAPVAYGLPLAAFAAVAAVAELAGAANLGTALGIGQVAFAAVLVYVLMRG